MKIGFILTKLRFSVFAVKLSHFVIKYENNAIIIKRSSLIEKTKKVFVSQRKKFGRIKLGRYKIFHNDSDTIRYRINYLKDGIIDIDTKKF